MKKKILIILCVFLIALFAGYISWNQGKESDENGCFMMDFSFESGGNYIMIDYENFTGSIELRCAEEDEVNEE